MSVCCADERHEKTMETYQSVNSITDLLGSEIELQFGFACFCFLLDARTALTWCNYTPEPQLTAAFFSAETSTAHKKSDAIAVVDTTVVVLCFLKNGLVRVRRKRNFLRLVGNRKIVLETSGKNKRLCEGTTDLTDKICTIHYSCGSDHPCL